MPLERQVISIPLAQGVDTKTDAKQVAAGKLLELENGVFTTLKAIRKRDGNVLLGKDIVNAVGLQSVSSGRALATFQNELLLSDGSAFYSRDEAQDGWVNKGTLVSAIVSSTPVVKDNFDQQCPDGAVHSSGIEAYAWEDSSLANTVKYALIDGVTGQTIVSSRIISANACKPRVLCCNNKFLFYWMTVTGAPAVVVGILPVSTPNATIVPITLTGSPASVDGVNINSPNYDVCIVEDTISLVFCNDVGTTTLRSYNPVSPASQLVTQAIIPYLSRSICVFPTNNGQAEMGPTVAYTTDNGTNFLSFSIRYASYSKTLDVVISAASLFSTFFYTVNLTGCQKPVSGIGFDIFANFIDGSDSIVLRFSVNSSFSVATYSPWKVSTGIWARAFSYNGSTFVPVSYTRNINNETVQKTYFLCNENGRFIASMLSGVAGDFPRPTYVSALQKSRPVLAGVNAIRDGVFKIACTQQALINGAGLATPYDVSALTIDFVNAQNSYGFSTLATNLHATGGMVQMYDGTQIVEHGFCIYPDYVATSVSPSGNLTAGKYTYAVCYEWIDAQGNLHQSRPNFSEEVTVVNGDRVEITFPYLQQTNKTSANPVQVIIYRTLHDGTIFYRVTSLTSPTLNVINTKAGSFIDTMSDDDLSIRPELYTQPLAGPGYVVENDPAPSSSLIQLHRNRLWVLNSTNKLQIWYSKEIEPQSTGYPVAFNSGFVRQIDPRGGPVTALATVDDKLLVFKRSHIFFIVGQGPLNNGENNDFSDAILITTDCGCIDPRSVVGTPVGIMFQSAKGIYLIDRSLQVQYIGAPVEAYNKETITSATLVANTNQVRFTLENGKTLVFDYYVQQWGTFTNQLGVDGLVWQDTMMLLRANGSVLRETPGVFTDAGSPIRLRLSTSWLSFANVQGFQRVRRAQILGGWRSPHDLLVSVAVDFNDNIVQQATVTPTSPIMYGESSPYGYESVYGGNFQLYQWRIDLARQKTQAVKFTIEDLPEATAGTGEGMTLTSIGFEVGTKTGLNKVPASQIFS